MRKTAYVKEGVLYDGAGTFLAKVQDNQIVDENGKVLAESTFLSLFGEDLGYQVVDKPPVRMRRQGSGKSPEKIPEKTPEQLLQAQQVQMNQLVVQALQGYAEKHQGKVLIKSGVMARFILPDSKGQEGQFRLDWSTLECTPEYPSQAGLKQTARIDWLVRTHAPSLKKLVEEVRGQGN